jgi:hypothetical protein
MVRFRNFPRRLSLDFSGDFSGVFSALVFSLALSGQALAALGPPTPRCDLIFEATPSIEADVQNPTFGAEREEIVKLDGILNQIKSDSAKLTDVLIASYLALRLYHENPEAQAIALHFAGKNLAERNIKFTNSNQNEYDPKSKQIKLAFLEEFANTPLFGFYFAHEFEHLLQDLKLGNQRFARLTSPGEDRVKIEEAAMRAEFAYVLLIPLSVRKELMKLWSKPESQTHGSLSLFVMAVTISLRTSNTDDYIRAMWGLNRYRPKAFVKPADEVPVHGP